MIKISLQIPFESLDASNKAPELWQNSRALFSTNNRENKRKSIQHSYVEKIAEFPASRLNDNPEGLLFTQGNT